MTDRIALTLGLVITLCLALDLVVNDGIAVMFLLRKFDALIEWAAFWR